MRTRNSNGESTVGLAAGAKQSWGIKPWRCQLRRDERRRNVVSALNKYHLHFTERTNVVREEGQALVEYALILAMITVVTLAVLQLLGVDVSRILDKVSSSLSSAAG
jgi:pilus assembly protein Flp/PilA